MQSARRSRILALQGRTIVLARLLRRTEGRAQLVAQLVPPTAAPNHYPNPLSLSAVSNQGPGPEAKSVARKRCRKRVRVEGLYLEREPKPQLHAQALLKLIQDECPEKVGSFIPCSHLDRAYRELCTQEGWKALSWLAIARALGKLTRRRLLKTVRGLWLTVSPHLRTPGPPHRIAPGLPPVTRLRSRWATSRWTQRPFAQRSRNASWRQQKAASGIQMAEVDRPSGSRRLERKAFRGILDGE